MDRFLTTCILLSVSIATPAQAVERHHLLTTLGAGAGVVRLASDRDDLAEEALECGALRFAFGYAITDRWSIGFHYDRIGSAFHSGSLEHLHLTTYLLEGSYRPWTGQRASVECSAGIGATAAALFPYGSRLPFTAGGSAFAIGARYLYLLTGTLGLFVSADHATTSSNELVLEGGEVNADGSISRLQWNGQRITAGVLVRF
jgi:hypothetical protein